VQAQMRFLFWEWINVWKIKKTRESPAVLSTSLYAALIAEEVCYVKVNLFHAKGAAAKLLPIYFMRTLQAWINAHPGVNVLAFERNSNKSFGFGSEEEVCGFCLASHYFDGEPPEKCKFCRSPLQETRVISDLPEIKNRIYKIEWFAPAVTLSGQKLLFIVPKDNCHE
jgi:hypothetical protein